MPRPDYQRMRREANTIYEGAGEAATVKKWIGDATGNPRFGVQNANNYTELTVTALFKNFGPTIVASQGGWIQVNALAVTLPFELTPRDQLIYNGSAYRVDGSPDRETFGAGRVLYHHPLKLASVTG